MLSILALAGAQAQNGTPNGAPSAGDGAPAGDQGQQFPRRRWRGQGGDETGPGTDDPERQRHHQMILDKFDTNHDGKLDDNERAQMRAWMQQHRENGGPGGGPDGRMFGRGGPGSGQPSSGSGMPNNGTPPAGGGAANGEDRQQHRERLMERFDTNHDGKLDDNERAKMESFMQQRRQRRQQNGGQSSGDGGHGPAPAGGPNNGNPD